MTPFADVLALSSEVGVWTSTVTSHPQCSTQDSGTLFTQLAGQFLHQQLCGTWQRKDGFDQAWNGRKPCPLSSGSRRGFRTTFGTSLACKAAPRAIKIVYQLWQVLFPNTRGLNCSLRQIASFPNLTKNCCMKRSTGSFASPTTGFLNRPGSWPAWSTKPMRGRRHKTGTRTVAAESTQDIRIRGLSHIKQVCNKQLDSRRLQYFNASRCQRSKVSRQYPQMIHALQNHASRQIESVCVNIAWMMDCSLSLSLLKQTVQSAQYFFMTWGHGPGAPDASGYTAARHRSPSHYISPAHRYTNGGDGVAQSLRCARNIASSDTREYFRGERSAQRHERCGLCSQSLSLLIMAAHITHATPTTGLRATTATTPHHEAAPVPIPGMHSTSAS